MEFQWICKQNNVHVVYIPPHSSHVLQPLDLSCFSAVKSHYRKQNSELAILDNAAPVKKRRFVKCYHHAQEEGLTTRVIQAGWRATGLVPYNPQSVINSSQVLARSQDQQSLSPQPRKRSRNSTTMEFETPRKPAQFAEVAAQPSTDGFPGERCQAFFNKTRKALEEVVVLQAEHTKCIEMLEARVRELEGQPT